MIGGADEFIKVGSQGDLFIRGNWVDSNGLDTVLTK